MPSRSSTNITAWRSPRPKPRIVVLAAVSLSVTPGLSGSSPPLIAEGMVEKASKAEREGSSPFSSFFFWGGLLQPKKKKRELLLCWTCQAAARRENRAKGLADPPGDSCSAPAAESVRHFFFPKAGSKSRNGAGTKQATRARPRSGV